MPARSSSGIATRRRQSVAPQAPPRKTCFPINGLSSRCRQARSAIYAQALAPPFFVAINEWGLADFCEYAVDVGGSAGRSVGGARIRCLKVQRFDSRVERRIYEELQGGASLPSAPNADGRGELE